MKMVVLQADYQAFEDGGGPPAFWQVAFCCFCQYLKTNRQPQTPSHKLLNHQNQKTTKQQKTTSRLKTGWVARANQPVFNLLGLILELAGTI